MSIPAISVLGNSSAEVVFELYNKDDEALLAKGGLTQVFIDSKTRKSMPIPSFYREAILKRQPQILELIKQYPLCLPAKIALEVSIKVI